MQNKLIVNHRILFIGIGIFFWLAIGNFAYFVQTTFRDVCFNLGNFSPLFIKIFAEILNPLTYLICFIILIRVIKLRKVKSKHIFLYLLIILIVGQIFQFIEPLIIRNFKSEIYVDNVDQYLEYFESNPYYKAFIEIPGSIIYIIVGIIIYINWNKYDNWDFENNQEINSIGKEHNL